MVALVVVGVVTALAGVTAAITSTNRDLRPAQH